MKVKIPAIAALTILTLTACQPQAALSPQLSGKRGINPPPQRPIAKRLPRRIAAEVNSEIKTITAELQAILDRKVARQNIPGVAAYVSTPEGTWMGASGVADLKTKRPLKPSDRFRIGSITKTFVAVVVLQLWEEQELSLDDAIADWLPETLLPEKTSARLANSEKITIRQLLNHTSGLTDYLESDEFQADFEADSTHHWTAREVLEYAYDLEPEAEPGEEFSYSNTNYIILELIVEEVTGNRLAQELRDRIYEPLGLQDTFMELQEKITGGFVSGYDDWDEDGRRDNVTRLEAWGLGDGGIVSTASDVGKFIQALFAQEELLAEDSLGEMLDLVDDGEGDGYGLGVAAWENSWGEEVWGHDGETGGFVATMMYFGDRYIAIVVLINAADEGEPDEIAEALLELIIE